MNTNWLLFSLTPCVALPLILQTPQVAGRKLERITASDAGREAPGSDQRFDAQAWKQKLSDPDLAQRERAYSELVERARSDREAHAALEEWSRASDAPELAWTARLALRESERAGRTNARGRGGLGQNPNGQLPGGEWNDLRARLDELERHFGGMDSMFEELRSQMDRRNLGAPQDPGTLPDPWSGAPPQSWGGLHAAPVPPGGEPQFQSYQLQVGPDGVTLETTEKVNGQEQKKTYKAKDLEQLLEANPELRDKIGGGLPIDMQHFELQLPNRNGWFFGDDQGADDWLRPARPSSAPPTDVLGIYPQKLSAEEAQALGLEPEQGLRIERVEPGTIAQILGLRRGDTIVELNGKPIYSTDDVKRILKERAQDGDVVVTLVGEGSKDRRTLRWTPSEPQPGPDKPKKL